MLVKSDNKDDLRFTRASPILTQLPSSYSLVFSHQLPQQDWLDCFFFQDEEQVFVVEKLRDLALSYQQLLSETPEQEATQEITTVQLKSDIEVPREAISVGPSFPWEPSTTTKAKPASDVGATLYTDVMTAVADSRNLFRFENVEKKVP